MPINLPASQLAELERLHAGRAEELANFVSKPEDEKYIPQADTWDELRLFFEKRGAVPVVEYAFVISDVVRRRSLVWREVGDPIERRRGWRRADRSW